LNTGRASNTGRGGSDIIVPIEAGGFYSRKYGILSTQLYKGFCVCTTQLNTAKALLQIHINHQHRLVLSEPPFKPIWFVCGIDSFSETERSTSSIKKTATVFFRPQSSQSFIFHSLAFFGHPQKMDRDAEMKPHSTEIISFPKLDITAQAPTFYVT